MRWSSCGGTISTVRGGEERVVDVKRNKTQERTKGTGGGEGRWLQKRRESTELIKGRVMPIKGHI